MKTMMANRLFAIVLILAAAVPAFAEPVGTPKTIRLGAVSQSWASKDRGDRPSDGQACGNVP